ncbi:MAG: hypothetical protein WBO69_11335 [Thermoanaerobaculia bacterium]
MTPTSVWNLDRTKKVAVVLVLLVAAGCFLRFFRLTEQSLWYDEGVTLEFSEGNSAGEITDKLGNTQSSERYQPLYFVLLYSWRGLFGSSEIALKAFSAILGALALIVFALGTRSFLDGTTRVVSVAFMAVSSFAIYYSQEARPYSLLLLLCVTHWYLIGRLFRSETPAQTRNLLVPAAFASCLGGLSSLFFSFHMASAGAAWLLVRGKRSREWSFWIVSGLALVPSLLFFALAGPNGGEDSAVVSRTDNSLLANAAFSLYGLLVGVTYGPPVDALRLGPWGEVLRQSWPSLLVFVLVCVGIFYSALVGFRMTSRDNRSQGSLDFRYLLASFGLGLVLLALFALATRLNWLPRHSTFLLPALGLALGCVFASRGDGPAAWQKIGRWSVIGLLVLNVLSLKHYYYDSAHRRGDYRAVAELLRNQQPMPIILLLGSPRLLDYYEAPSLLDVRWKQDPEKVRLIDGYTEGSNGFLVVINREDLLPGGLQGVEHLLMPLSKLENTWELPAFRVAEFSKISLINPRVTH